MRECGLTAQIVAPHLVGDKGLAGRERALRRFQKTRAVRYAFTHARNRLRRLVLHHEVDEVADVDVAGVARGDVVAEADAPLHALCENESERAALDYETDGARNHW